MRYLLFALLLLPKVAYGYESTGYLKDANKATIKYDVSIVPKYAYTYTLKQPQIDVLIDFVAVETIAEFNSYQIKSNKTVLKAFVKNLQKRLSFYGYQYKQLQINDIVVPKKVAK